MEGNIDKGKWEKKDQRLYSLSGKDKTDIQRGGCDGSGLQI